MSDNNNVSTKKQDINDDNQQEKLVPNLRFPEFTDEWRSKKLGDLSDVTKLAGFEFTKYVNYSDNGNIIALRGVNIKKNKLDLTDVKYIDNSDFNKLNRSKLYPGDLLFTYVGTIGNVALIFKKNKYYLAPNVCRIRSESFINSQFLKFYFNTQLIKKEINRYVTKSSQPALSMENIRKFNVNIPNIKEQNKIANFISLIDRKIDLLEKRLILNEQTLNYYNCLLLKKLKYSNPKMYKLGDILINKSSNLKINDLKENEGNYPLYGADGFLKNINFCEQKQDYIAIVKDGSGVGNLFLFKKNSSIVGTMQYLIPKQEFNIYFVYYLLKTINLNKYKIGSSIPHIYFKDYSKEKVIVPSINIQMRIGKFLHNIKMKSNLINLKINYLKSFKKGLMQKMFI